MGGPLGVGFAFGLGSVGILNHIFRIGFRFGVILVGFCLAFCIALYFEFHKTELETRRLLVAWESEYAKTVLDGADPFGLKNKLQRQLEWQGVYLKDAVQGAQSVKCLSEDVLGVSYFGVPAGEWSLCYSEAAMLLRAIKSPSFIVAIALLVIAGFGFVTLRQREQNRRMDLLQSREKQEALEHLARSVAHDLKSPLTALEILSTIQSESLQTETQELFRNSVNRIRGISSEVLETSKKQVVRSTQLATLLKEFQNIASEQQLSFAGHQIRWTIGDITTANDANEESPSVSVSVMEIGRAFQNLLGNALEASPDKSQIVQVSFYCDLKDWIFIIQDEGVGMTAEQLKILGTPGATWGKVQGTGFGVAGTQMVIRRYGGTIQYQSYKDRGTRVTVRIPLEASINESRIHSNLKLLFNLKA